MTIFYSAATGSFIDDSIEDHSIPPDALEISDALYAEIVAALDAGKTIVPGDGGFPVVFEQIQSLETLWYSAVTGGFYSSTIHGAAIPADAVEITAQEHAALLAAQTAGKRIEAGGDGRPQAVDAPPSAPSVPRQVTMRQARLALLAAGKLAAVDLAIAALPSPQKEAAQIEWDYAAIVERASPIVALLGPALNLDEAALDAIFVASAAL